MNNAAAPAQTRTTPAMATNRTRQEGTPGRARGPAPEPDATGADPRRWLILAVVALAQLMVVLDATIVNIALPSAQQALHFSNIERQWVVTAYALAFGSLLLLGGRLTDLIGRKATFIAGLIGFAAASAVGGAAGSFGMLVAARACQGAFGALLAPAALSLLTTTFEGTKDRGKAFGVFGAIAGAGGAVGLLLGGLLTQYLNWRWCLYVNLVFAAIACAGAVVLLHRQPAAGGRGWTCPGSWPRSAACSASSTASPTRPVTAGMRQPRGASSPRAPCCWQRSASSRRGPASRCCRCGSSWTATGPPPTCRSWSPAPACSASSCSSPTTCRRPWASARSWPASPSCPWSARSSSAPTWPTSCCCPASAPGGSWRRACSPPLPGWPG